VDFSVGSKFTINGKELVTKDFLDFMSKHQADLVQVSAVGAPAPMSPSAGPEFTSTLSTAGTYLTNQATNTNVSKVLPLEST
jgi:hypothetical protein